jgi:predicted HNH restriction endonuclease
MKKCDYGCGQKAEHEMNNGKVCCSKNWQSCPAMKKKNSRGLKEAHKRGDASAKHLDGNRAWNKNGSYEIGQCNKLPISETKDKYSIKRKLIEQRGRKCEGCNEKTHRENPIPLDIHRIDEDKSYHESEKEDLELLCPNCHRLTDNWGKKKP